MLNRILSYINSFFAQKSKFPYYVDIPLSADTSGNITEWTNTKISNEDEERDIITTAERFIEKNERKALLP
tara:strand:+ start:3669 stop:3881 length:213 start_codon:yes stop_codon:yes gene_type:complete